MTLWILTWCMVLVGAVPSLAEGSAADDRVGLTYTFSGGYFRQEVPEVGSQTMETFGLTMVNGGDAPRVVYWTFVAVDGQPVGSWQEMAGRLGRPPQDLRFWTQLNPKEVFDVGREVDLFRLNSPKHSYQASKLHIETCVCSLDASSCWLVGHPGAEASDEKIGPCRDIRPTVVLHGN